MRSAVPRLPEATGETNGITGNFSNRIRLVTLGESTVAGVGVANHQEGFSGQLAFFLSELSESTVYWQVLAKSGYSAKEVAEELAPHLPETEIDVIVIGLGGNDTFRIHSPRRWQKDLFALIKNVRKKQSTAQIVIANMPPIGQFPAFTPLMQFFLGSLVNLHGMAAKNLAAKLDGVFYIDQPIKFEDWVTRTDKAKTADDFFSDGVHPSPLTYSLWGKEVAEFIVSKQLLGANNITYSRRNLTFIGSE